MAMHVLSNAKLTFTYFTSYCTLIVSQSSVYLSTGSPPGYLAGPAHLAITRVLWGDHGRPSSSAGICCLYPRPAESHGNSAKEQHERREDSAGQKNEQEQRSVGQRAQGWRRGENEGKTFVDASTQGVRVMIADSLQVGSDSGRRGSDTLARSQRGKATDRRARRLF